MTDPRAYLVRWKGILETASDARVLNGMWSGPTETKQRNEIDWPAGMLEELTALVQRKIDQLSRPSAESRP